MYNRYKGSRLCVWIRLRSDPHEEYRGFSILNRELRVMTYEPVAEEMEDFRGHRMKGLFWPVEASEVYRVIPEMKRFPIRNEAWFFPFEFCEAFLRPKNFLNMKINDVTLKWE